MIDGQESTVVERPLEDLAIAKRETIDAPSEFATVFHETLTDRLQQIDNEGLIPGKEANIMSNDLMQRKNKAIDEVRPSEIVKKGVSRSNLYGYLSLKEGHGLMGATERFVTRNEGRSKEELRREYPGEALELKVDPSKVYVADMGYINDIQETMDRRRDLSLERIAAGWGEDYWKSLMTLKEFQEYFKKTPGEYDWEPAVYTKQDKTPDSLPESVRLPEVLIPSPVPQEHIRVIK